MKRIFLTLIIALSLACDLSAASAAELIRGNAKFNAVVIVLGIIFIGIILFLVRLDKKVSRLEKKEDMKS